MKVKTRFAPSPSGHLHLGGARTALFNYLFSKHMKGEFLLRIENTDKNRSTLENINSIKNSLSWINLLPEEKIIIQSENYSVHEEIAYKLLKKDFAFKCYLTNEELSHLKNISRKSGIVFKSPYREEKSNLKRDYVIRLKMPQVGNTSIIDRVQGNVSINNSTLDDMIILRIDK